ncbi:MAG: hypothetical protein K2X35_04370 [Bryobacteraceae bacterium]|nr:hypothetical protein [Bryobacteraceae bacterium]
MSQDQAASLVYLLFTLFGLFSLLLWMWQQAWRARIQKEIREAKFCLDDLLRDRPELRISPQVSALSETLGILEARPELCGFSAALVLRLLAGSKTATPELDPMLMALRAQCPGMEKRLGGPGTRIFQIISNNQDRR